MTAQHPAGDSVQVLLDVLAARQADAARSDAGYRVPQFVLDPDAGTDLVDIGNPYTFYLNLILSVTAPVASQIDVDHRRALTETDVVYLSYLRTGAAMNGRIGTALSQLALLPHLQRLGVTVLLTLPTGRIGQANRKGSRGSPFAIADPFTVDASLADPLLPELTATTQYQALIAICAHVGIRCGSIVPAATLALDSRLIARFPEITYWWDLPPGTSLRAATVGAATAGLPDATSPIDQAISARFARPPAAHAVTNVEVSGAEFWVSADGLTPATACPDVLAGESGTYSWSDVVGIRFGGGLVPDLGPVHSDPTPANRAVQIAALSIAWRAAVLGEQIFWIDVAARVPPAMLDLSDAIAHGWGARTDELTDLLSSDPALVKHDTIGELLNDVTSSATSRSRPERRLTFIAEELYRFHSDTARHDAVVGPWVFCVAPFTRDLPTLRTSIRHHLSLLAEDDATDMLFLAGLGDHDTAPPDPKLAAGLLAMTWLLPRGIPMLFTGHEFRSELVINKEFGFNTTPALRAWRDDLVDSTLPLFNDVPMRWADLDPAHDVAAMIRQVLAIRRVLHRRMIDQLELIPELAAGDVLGYRRVGSGSEAVAVYLNTSSTTTHLLDLPPGSIPVVATAGQSGVNETLPGVLSPFSATVYASPALASVLPTE